MAVERLDKRAHDKFGILCFTPRHDSENADLHRQVQRCDSENGKKNSARNIAFRVANLSAQMADVVVAPITVNRVDHCGPESREPYPGKRKRAWRKIERHFRIEMTRASPDQPEQRGDHARPQKHGNFSDSG